MKQSPRSHCRLSAAVRALPVPVPVGQEAGMLTLPAGRADEARWPARLLQRRLALFLGAVPTDELA